MATNEMSLTYIKLFIRANDSVDKSKLQKALAQCLRDCEEEHESIEWVFANSWDEEFEEQAEAASIASESNEYLWFADED